MDQQFKFLSREFPKQNRLMDLENEFMVASGRDRGRDIREFGKVMYTLLY